MKPDQTASYYLLHIIQGDQLVAPGLFGILVK